GSPPDAASPMPSVGRSSERTGQVVLLVLMTVFLFDTFLPWQRACVSLDAPRFHFAGCLSLNAWSGTANHVGQAAGVLAILTVVLLGLRGGGVDLGDLGEVGVRIGVYG